MNTQTIGAQKRRTLSLHFNGGNEQKAPYQTSATSTIPVHELRRLVAAMID